MTRISVVIPSYNRADTLGRALASAYAQARAPDEVILVDDGSTDGTAGVLTGFPDVRVVRHERPRGAGAARNAGVRVAQGDWIAFLDSDDAWDARKLEVQSRAIESAASPDLVCSAITVHEAAGSVATHGLAGISPDTGWTFAEFQNYPFSPSTWLVRRAVFEAAGGFDESMANCEDLDLLARLSGACRMQVLADTLVTKYNQHDSLDANLQRTAMSYRQLFARHERLWSRSPQALVASHRRLADMYMHAGDAGGARASLWRAIRARPGQPRAWILVLASLLGSRAYFRAGRALG